MSILSGIEKVKKYVKQSSGYKILSQWTSSQTVEMNDGTVLQEKIESIDSNIDKKANIESPELTGIPKAPTAPTGTDSTQIATTAFVQDALSSKIQETQVTGVKGNAESTFRKGDVNLTPANIGALALTGGKLTGNISIESNATCIDASVELSTPKRSGMITVNPSEELVFYDKTFNKPIVTSDKKGNITLNGTATNSDTVDNFHASSFLGNETGYVHPGINGGDASNYKTEFHGFVYNMSNTPANYGFLDVAWFNGAGFSPSVSGVVLQRFTKWDTGEIYTRVYASGSWTSWKKIALADQNWTLRTTSISFQSGTSAVGGYYATGGSVTVGSYSELVVVAIGSNGWITNWSYSGTTLTVNALKSGSSAQTINILYFTR